MKVIDTHVHLWWRGDGFPVRIRDRIPALDADFLLDDLAACAPGVTVDRIVLVSSAQAAAETERLLAVADRSRDTVAGVIGFLHPDQHDFSHALAHWAGREDFLGLRLPLVVFDDPAWIRGERVKAALFDIARNGLVAQVLAAPEHLDHCTRALEMHSELICVLDHAGNPPVRSGAFEPWASSIDRFAGRVNAWCKVSDFHQAGDPALSDEQILPYLHHVITVFGSERMVAGSNWPVSSLRESYGTTFSRLDRMMLRLGLETPRREAILHKNASRLIAAVQGRRTGLSLSR
ncbi:MAG: amidohydrolase family protein [Microvirga sp.]